MFKDIDTEEKINDIKDPEQIQAILDHAKHIISIYKINRASAKGTDSEKEENKKFREDFLIGNQELGLFGNHLLAINGKPLNTMKYVQRLSEVTELLANERMIMENRELSLQNYNTAKYTLRVTWVILVMTIISLIIGGISIWLNLRN